MAAAKYTVGLLLVAIVGVFGESPFPSGKESVYLWNASIWTGTRLPKHVLSQWDLHATLRIQAQENAALMQVSDLYTSLSNGEVGSLPPLDAATPVRESPLLGSFRVSYSGGRAASVELLDNEPLWAHNMKRALASLFQLDLATVRNTANLVIENTEETIHGNCKVKYIMATEAGNRTVRKFTDHKNCDAWTQESWSNMVPHCSSAKAQSPLTSHSETVYTLSSSEYDQPNIAHIKSSGILLMQPFQASAEMQYMQISQSLTLQRQESTKDRIARSGPSRSSGLAYQHVEYLIHDKEGRDQAVAQVMVMLGRLAERLAQSNVVPDHNKLHDPTAIVALEYLIGMDYTGLEQLYSSVFVGTSYEQETMGNLLLEMLPQVGTGDALLFTINLVKDRKVTDWTAMQLLMALPFYLRQPSLFRRPIEEMLTACEPMILLGEDISSDVQKTAILTFASLVNKMCVNGLCKPETVDKYVRLYVDKFTESTTYEQQMIYLEGLSNMEMGQVADFLEPVIRGNVSDLSGHSSHHIRFLAVWASMNTALRAPDRVYQLYWPILTNSSEHLEMRVAAITMLMLSLDTPARYWSLYWYIRSQNSNHLYNYFYTTIQSLAQTKYPCYSHLGQVAAQLVRLVPEPEDRIWPTGNYIVDYEQQSLGLGAMLQLVMVGSERTFQPTVLLLKFNKHAGHRTLADFALYVKAQGVSESFQSAIINIDPINLKVSHLADLLRSVKIYPRSPEPIHIEIMLKREERVIMCYHINNSFNNLIKLKEKATTLLSQFHVNAQRLWYPVLVEMTQPTLLGTPAKIRLSSSALGSLRGDFTQELDTKSIIRHNRLDVRMSVTVETVLNTYNPLAKLYHGVDRSLGFHAQIPFLSKISFDMKNLHVSLGPLNETVGAAGHLRSGVFVQGPTAETALFRHCKKCFTYHTVNYNSDSPPKKTRQVVDLSVENIGAKLQVSLFDCDRPYTTLDYIKLAAGLFDPHTNNYHMAFKGLPLLSIVHLVDVALVQAPRGSCGIITTLRTIGSRNTELDVAVRATTDEMTGSPEEPLPGDIRKIHLTLTHRERGHEVALHQIDIDAIHSRFAGHSKHDLKLKLKRAENGAQTHMMCLEADWNMPPWHPDLIPLSDTITGQVNTVWGIAEGSGYCPVKGSALRLKAKAEATMEQLAMATSSSSWPYDQCKKDTTDGDEWGETFTPFTAACQEEARQLATLRKYTVTLRYSNLPENLVSLSKRIEGILEMVRPLEKENARRELTASVEFPVREPIVNITLNSRDLSLDYSSLGFAPLLYNARFPRPNTNLGFVSSCIVTTKRVISWDNATVSHPLSSCYTLAAADCTRQPKFALFIKKVPGSKPLAVKLYTGGSYVELLPENGKVHININGKSVPSAKLGFAYPMQDTFYSFKVWEKPGELFEVESKTSFGWLQYYGHSALFMLGPGLYSGNTCGLCGDLNGNPANDYGEPAHVLPCETHNAGFHF